MAFIQAPGNSLAADVNSGSVVFEGARHVGLIYCTLFPLAFATRFCRPDMVDIILRDQRSVKVGGVIGKTGGNVMASESDVINVLSTPVMTKEEPDDVVNLTCEKVSCQVIIPKHPFPYVLFSRSQYEGLIAHAPKEAFKQKDSLVLSGRNGSQYQSDNQNFDFDNYSSWFIHPAFRSHSPKSQESSIYT